MLADMIRGWHRQTLRTDALEYALLPAPRPGQSNCFQSADDMPVVARQRSHLSFSVAASPLRDHHVQQPQHKDV